MRLGWAIVGGVAMGAAVAWWASRDTPEQAQRKQQRAAQAAAADAEDARPVLYRWRDAGGVLHITEEAPRPGEAVGQVERIDREPRDGIEIRGD
jgi:hypothetical protein